MRRAASIESVQDEGRAALASMAVLSCGDAAAQAQPEAPRNLVVQTVAQDVRKEQRLALVVGNSAYKEAPLDQSGHDARAIPKPSRQPATPSSWRTDTDHRGLLAAVRDFGDRLRKGGSGLFYFAGHGMQIKGRNYLIPVGADIQREDEVATPALDAQAVLDKMEAASNGTNLMIPGCLPQQPVCTQLPVGQSWPGTDGGAGGHTGRLRHGAGQRGQRRPRPERSVHAAPTEAMKAPGLKVEDVLQAGPRRRPTRLAGQAGAVGGHLGLEGDCIS